MNKELSINKQKNLGFSGNMLKIIAAVTMVIDHFGVIFFPKILIFRIIGRIAFPIFAYMIAEGCTYTKNKLRYFLGMFILGVLCQIVYYIFDKSLYMGILITFSFSILIIYAMQFLKNTLFDNNEKAYKKIIAIIIFCVIVTGVYIFTTYFTIDYFFEGCMAPVFVSLFRKPKNNNSYLLTKLDNKFIHIMMLGISLIIISFKINSIQFYSLLSLPLLLLYSGKRGKYKMKYFFYIFYPLHLGLLELIYMIFFLI